MNPQSEEFSPRRARNLTLLVLIGVAAWIALANLSTELVTFDFLTDSMQGKKPLERAYGWPLAWYWRSYTYTPYSPPAAFWSRPFADFLQNLRAPWNPREPISRYSTLRLIANLTMLLALLAAVWASCMRLLSRGRVRFRGRLRPTTLLLAILVSALFLLSNLSCDAFPERRLGAEGQFSYGWPWLWYRHFNFATMTALLRVSDYSAAALASNVAAWLATLAATAFGWQWLLRRYQPRFRWRLRTMFIGAGLASALCAWYVTARDRARQQDAVLASIGGDDNVYYERFGPKWLDFFGADSLRRRIVAAVVHQEQMKDDVFKQLAPLRSLRLLDITPHLYHQPFVFTPAMAASLGEMRQLRTLNVSSANFDLDESRTATRECLAAIGKLTQLRRLRLRIWEESNDDLKNLAGLTNLKMLTLQIFPRSLSEIPEEAEREDEARTLGYLPALPRLEILDLEEEEIGDEDLGRLVAFPQLKSLNLSVTSVSEEGLAKLATLKSLEELAIDEDVATEASFEALAKIKRLKAVHIATSEWIDENDEEKLVRRVELFEPDPAANEEPTLVKLSLDDGGKLAVLSFEVDGLRRAMEVLRRTHPGIVIDAAYREFAKKIDLEPQWNFSFTTDSSMRRLLGY